MESIEEILLDADEKMQKAAHAVEHELKSLKTGRASTSMVEGIMVEAYGTETPLKQVGSITTPDAATIAIQPWDVSILAQVEKAILTANIGLTPNNDGKMIRLNIPALTEQTRKDVVRRAHEIAEKGRISIRNVRRSVNDEIKKSQKNGDISEDEAKRYLDESQKETDAHIKQIDATLATKEAEIMKV